MNATVHLKIVKMVLSYILPQWKKKKESEREKEKATHLIDPVHESFLNVALAQLRASASEIFCFVTLWEVARSRLVQVTSKHDH